MSDEDQEVRQLVTYHTTDGSDWPINMTVGDTAKCLEEFHGHTEGDEWYPPDDTFLLSYSNGRTVHLKAHNVVALEVENLEDLTNAGSGTRRPPAKSRSSST
jgi:hypothetical protein